MKRIMFMIAIICTIMICSGCAAKRGGGGPITSYLCHNCGREVYSQYALGSYDYIFTNENFYCSKECLYEKNYPKDIKRYKEILEKRAKKEAAERREKELYARCEVCKKRDLKKNLTNTNDNGIDMDDRFYCDKCYYDYVENPVVDKCEICLKELREKDEYYVDPDDFYFHIKCHDCHIKYDR